MLSSRDAFYGFRNELDHHAYPTIAAWVENHNRYAIWEAALNDRFLSESVPSRIGRGKRFKRHLKWIALRLPFRPVIRFVYAYIVRLGFLDGRPGLIFCGLLAFYDFLATANRYEQALHGSSPDRADFNGAASPWTGSLDGSPREPAVKGLDQAEEWDDDEVLVCEDAPLPDAELEEPVCVDALLALPSPAPAVVDEEVEVWAFEPADPVLEDPEVAVCAPADPDPLPELGSGSFKVTVPIVTGGDAVVLSLGLVDPAPPVEVEVELPVVVPAVDPLLALVEGAPVLEPPLVCVFDEAPPPDAADDPEVVVFADADPEAGALDAELEELVVVLAEAPVDDEPVWAGVVPAGLVVFEEFVVWL